jgi:quercetin dioxygenase-like cupin family protein
MEEAKRPAYLRTHRITGRKLAFLLRAEEEAQLEKAKEKRSGRTAKTLVKDGPLRITLVGLRKGAEMKEHTVEGPASFQCLRGNLRFQLGEEEVELAANSLLVLDGGVPHNVAALSGSRGGRARNARRPACDFQVASPVSAATSLSRCSNSCRCCRCSRSCAQRSLMSLAWARAPITAPLGLWMMANVSST